MKQPTKKLDPRTYGCPYLFWVRSQSNKGCNGGMMTPIFPLIPFRRIFTPLRHSRVLRHRRLRPVSNGNGMSPVDVFVPPINPCKHNKAWLNQDDVFDMEHVTFLGSNSWIPRNGSSGLAHTHIPTSRPPLHLLRPCSTGNLQQAKYANSHNGPVHSA